MEIEIEEAIEIFEGEITLDEDELTPLCLKRQGSWKDVLKEDEHLFYEDEDEAYDFSSYSFDQMGSRLPGWFGTKNEPYIKVKTPGRNDPCPCGSGKKYKKCCIDKDG